MKDVYLSWLLLTSNYCRGRVTLDNEQLNQLVKEISIEYFSKSFLHVAYFNNRLRTTGGRYLLKSHDIEINPKYLHEQGEESVKEIIKHELCHYHLHIEGKGYKHRDHDFRKLLKEVGAPRFCTPLNEKAKKEVIKHNYRCKNCGQEYKRKRRVNTVKYVCGSCKGRLEKII